MFSKTNKIVKAVISLAFIATFSLPFSFSAAGIQATSNTYNQSIASNIDYNNVIEKYNVDLSNVTFFDIPNKFSSTKLLQGDYHTCGASKKYICKDNKGNQFLFKPRNKTSIYLQEAASKVQYLVDPDTYIPVRQANVIIDKHKKLGAIQPIIKTQSCPDFNDVNSLTEQVLKDLQREFITDWLLCNYDSHYGNFIRDEKGRIRGVDKEMAFSEIDKPTAQTMNITHKPSWKLSTSELVYYNMYNKYINSEIDLDLDYVNQYIDKIEKMPDNQYSQIFKKYTDSKFTLKKNSKKLLDKITKRKANLKTTYQKFANELKNKRQAKSFAR